MNRESTAYTIVFVFVVSFLFVFLLSATNEFTVDLVRSNQETARQRAVLAAMGIPVTDPEEVAGAYRQVADDPEAGLYASVVDGHTVYALQFTGAGVWGQISGVLAVSSDFRQVVGLEIVDDNETPGLGGRINEPGFKDQFRGVVVGDDRLTIGGPGSLVDGITGATGTSNAMESILNELLELMRSEQVRARLRQLEREGGST